MRKNELNSPRHSMRFNLGAAQIGWSASLQLPTNSGPQTSLCLPDWKRATTKLARLIILVQKLRVHHVIRMWVTLQKYESQQQTIGHKVSPTFHIYFNVPMIRFLGFFQIPQEPRCFYHHASGQRSLVSSKGLKNKDQTVLFMIFLTSENPKQCNFLKFCFQFVSLKFCASLNERIFDFYSV